MRRKRSLANVSFRPRPVIRLAALATPSYDVTRGRRLVRGRSIPTRALLVCCAILAACGCTSTGSWIAGSSVGYTHTGVDACNSGGLYTAGTCSMSTSHAGGKLFGGYQFNRFIGVEGGVAYLGSFTQNESGTVP